MTEVYSFHAIGRCIVPDKWNNDMDASINRLYYIHSGSGGYIKDGEKNEYQIGRLYLLPAFANIYTFSSLTDKIDHTYVSYELIPPILTKDVLSIDPYSKPDIKVAFEVFLALCSEGRAKKDKNMKKYLAHTVAYLSEKIAEENDCSILKDITLIKALTIMHSQIKENRSIADIAEECGMSTDGFIRKFKAYIGQTPYDYLKKLKIRVALKLRELGNSWEEIAVKCGYADQTSLLHAIKTENKKALS